MRKIFASVCRRGAAIITASSCGNNHSIVMRQSSQHRHAAIITASSCGNHHSIVMRQSSQHRHAATAASCLLSLCNVSLDKHNFIQE
jgi:hypothetical protein